MTAISVVLCTHNPDQALLNRVLDALEAQTAAFELLIVDNNSRPPLDQRALPGAGAKASLLKESRQGLSFARVCGISNAQAPLICFVDDDNLLQPDYLEQAMAIAAAHSDLGAFGGAARGVFGAAPDWLVRRHIARYAVRDNGPEPISGPGDRWGPWEPFGAGLVVRADVARAFARLVNASQDAGGLGRAGARLGSGEDSLFSRVAHQLGYAVAYRPELQLDHVVASERLTWRYLFALVAGQARAQVTLNRICSAPEPPPAPPRWREPDLAIRRFIARLRTPGLYEAITHVAWDHAFWKAQRQPMSEGQRRLKAAFAELGSAERDDTTAPER